jgi:hypothetical protein
MRITRHPFFVLFAAAIVLTAAPAAAGPVRVNPTGVNVSTVGATTVFLTFGGLTSQRPAEAFWCGALIPAAPSVGQRCDPAKIFGQLPVRFDQSTTSGSSGFTDIMSIPASVARRAFEDARSGSTSSFFYVRRFVSLTGGPDEFVVVTCRMAGGGVRVPLSLTDVQLSFEGKPTVQFVQPGAAPPAITAEVTYTGTGRLRGRWEVVRPGQPVPEERDLLSEAALPIEERGTQQRYAEVQRLDVFLPPTGKAVIPGPDVHRIPTDLEGQYVLLLRIEATDDKAADSDLAAVGTGATVVHSGGVAGFAMPVLRYVVGSTAPAAVHAGGVTLLTPDETTSVPAAGQLDLTWRDNPGAVLYRVEMESRTGEMVGAAIVQPGTGVYRVPPFIKEKVTDKHIRWRVVALDMQGRAIGASVWRSVTFVEGS